MSYGFFDCLRLFAAGEVILCIGPLLWLPLRFILSRLLSRKHISRNNTSVLWERVGIAMLTMGKAALILVWKVVELTDKLVLSAIVAAAIVLGYFTQGIPSVSSPSGAATGSTATSALNSAPVHHTSFDRYSTQPKYAYVPPPLLRLDNDELWSNNAETLTLASLAIDVRHLNSAEADNAFVRYKRDVEDLARSRQHIRAIYLLWRSGPPSVSTEQRLIEQKERNEIDEGQRDEMKAMVRALQVKRSDCERHQLKTSASRDVLAVALPDLQSIVQPRPLSWWSPVAVWWSGQLEHSLDGALDSLSMLLDVEGERYCMTEHVRRLERAIHQATPLML